MFVRGYAHSGSGDKTFEDLDSGTYHVTEKPGAKWLPASVICTNSSGTVVGKDFAHIKVGDGETVDCSFYNAKKK